MKKEQKKALNSLINGIEFSQSKGVFSLFEASELYKSINVLIPLIQEKKQPYKT